MASRVCFSLILLPLLLLHSYLFCPLLAESTEKLYIVYMGEKQHDDPTLVTASHIDLLSSVLGSKAAARSSLVYSYKHGFSGFAAMLTDSQAKAIAEKTGVIKVVRSRSYQLQTTRSWNFLSLNLNHPSILLKRSKGGEDVIIGIIDSGIWPESRSFDDYGYGPIPSKWKGKCQVGNSSQPFRCNRKIIGARFYADGMDANDLKDESLSPRDVGGHGTHTASTAAGTLVTNISFQGLAFGDARGGAPRARIAVYKSMWGNGAGNDATVLAAIDDAMHDGVDILSLSLGGLEDTSFATLHANSRGITVIFAAGNDGPMPMSVYNSAPWVICVAATAIDRSYPTTITLGNNQTLVGQALYTRKETGNGVKDLVFSLGCDQDSLNGTNLAGKVLLCPAGEIPRSSQLSKIASYVVKAGGKGLVCAQYALNGLFDLDACKKIPCIFVDYEIGTKMTMYILTSSSPTVKFSQTVTVVGRGIVAPKVAGFSSRGPSTTVPGWIKPDIAAPGVNILAAMGNSYKLASGTSMAAPHVSGIIALLKALHPNWSPAVLKSALITTASITDKYGSPIMAEGLPRKPADPFDFGGGHVNPNRAADPGLVYDIDTKDYKDFIQCSQGDLVLCSPSSKPPYELNLPSISIPDLKKNTTVRRTVTNVGEVDAIYKVSFESPLGVRMDVWPKALVFNAVAKVKSFQVTFSPTRIVQGDYGFGGITWSNEKHSVRIPVAVRVVIRDFYSDVS